MQPGQSCSEDVELFSPERAASPVVEGEARRGKSTISFGAKVYANTSKADFEVQAPQYPGPFSICWTRGGLLVVPSPTQLKRVPSTTTRQHLYWVDEASQRLR